MAEPGPETAVGVPGIPGAVNVIDDDEADEPEVPPTLVAVALKV